MTSAGDRPSKGILSTLAILGEVEWARIDMGFDDFTPRRTPPFIVWRYKSESSDTPDLIRSSVRSYRGEIDWNVDKPGRNWIIQPIRVASGAPEFPGLEGRELLDAIAQSDPEYCESSIRDFQNLFEYLARLWRGSNHE